MKQIHNKMDDTKLCATCKKSFPLTQFVGFNQKPVNHCSGCRYNWAQMHDKPQPSSGRGKQKVHNPKPQPSKEKKPQNDTKPRKDTEKTTSSPEPDTPIQNTPHDQLSNSIYRQQKVYNREALHNRILFLLTREEFKSVATTPCFYCGVMEDRGFNVVDCLDPTKGYMLENCVGCCESCHNMKGMLDVNTFIRRMLHIDSRSTAIPESAIFSFPELFPDSKAVSYNTYRARILKHKWTFELSEEEYFQLLSMPCHVCGKESVNGHQNGIDRNGTEPLYKMDQCKPLCRQCNHMKRSVPLSDFLQKVNVIANIWRLKQTEIPHTTVQLYCLPVDNPKKTSKELKQDKKRYEMGKRSESTLTK